VFQAPPPQAAGAPPGHQLPELAQVTENRKKSNGSAREKKQGNKNQQKQNETKQKNAVSMRQPFEFRLLLLYFIL
jgi:hypothetical protein